jgi:hypothetical protein
VILKKFRTLVYFNLIFSILDSILKTLLMKKLLLGAMLLMNFMIFSQTSVYSDDFETSGTFIMSSTATNQWTINSIYSGMALPAVPSQPAGFSSPNGNYLHPVSPLLAGFSDQANYQLPDNDQMIAVMTSQLDLTNYNNTEISFWRTGGSEGLKVIYSINNGPWLDAYTVTGNPTVWQEETFSLTAVDGLNNIRIGFEFDGTAALDPAPNHYHSIDELNITADPISGADQITADVTNLIYCGDDQIDVDYDVVTGTINTGNNYTLELSDASGSFASATTIGSLASANTTGTITGTVPNGLSGSGFRVRVNSDDDPITGTQNNADITINTLPTVDAGQDLEVCEGDEVTLTATNPDGASISWDNGVTDNTAFTPTVTETYTVTADLNSCIATSQMTVYVSITPATPTIIVNANNDLEVSISGFQTVEWYLDGVLVNGQSGATITPTTNGNYTAIIVEGLCSSEESSPVVVDFVDLKENDLGLLSIYPNPANNVIHINSLQKKEIELNISDINGRSVFESKFSSNIQVDISKLESGIYFVQVSNQERSYKLVKK